MRRYCNQLLLLRCLTILLLVLLINDWRQLIELSRRLSTPICIVLPWDICQKKEIIKWSSVDIREPPPLRDTVAEALRLNEFLARLQYRCSKRREVGDIRRNNFVICHDPEALRFGYIETAVSVTGSAFADGSFEKALRANHTDLFVPEANRILKRKKNFIVHQLNSLKKTREWDLSDIIAIVAEQWYDVAKLELYSPYLAGGENEEGDQFLRAPSVFEAIMKVLRCRQLLLTVEIEPASAHRTIFLWYRIFHRLFYERRFALIGAEQDGRCGRAILHCRYRLTFLRFTKPQEAPVFGLGSPKEEYGRLITYLTSRRVNESCQQAISREDMPTICDDVLSSDNCRILYFRYRSLDRSIVVRPELGHCALLYFSPLATPMHFGNQSLIESIGISQHSDRPLIVPDETGKGNWQLLPFADILQRHQTKDTVTGDDRLVFDLDGGEWDVLDVIVATDLSRIRQISFRLRHYRLYFGEENENLRRFYLTFLQLENLGFHNVFSSRSHPSIDVVFSR